jgi:hypothetical protein
MWLKSDKISGTLREDQKVYHVVSSDLFGAKIKQAHYCASIGILSILHYYNIDSDIQGVFKKRLDFSNSASTSTECAAATERN